MPHPPPCRSRVTCGYFGLTSEGAGGELCAVLWSFASICETRRRVSEGGGMEGMGGGGGRTQVLCRARVCTVVQRDPRANRAATLPATQPSGQSSRPDFPGAGSGLLALPSPLSLSTLPAAGRISASWPELLTFAARVGRPLPDGHLVAKSWLSRLHQFCITFPRLQSCGGEGLPFGCAAAERRT